MRDVVTPIVVPNKEFESNKWYEKYEQLNSVLFTYQNSGRHSGGVMPYSEYIEGGLKEIRGVSHKFEILGYTLNPPFNPEYPSVAIMFEDKETFEKIWFHYVQ